MGTDRVGGISLTNSAECRGLGEFGLMTGAAEKPGQLSPVRGQSGPLLPARTRADLECTGLGVDLTTIRQDLTDSVDWAFDDPHHTVLVWRRGSVRTKEIEFDDGRGTTVTPRPGNLWIIPAGLRSAGVARGAEFEFRQLTVPRSVVGDSSLRPVVGRRDPIIHAVIERIASTAGRSDVVARLLRESLTDTLRLHLLDAYGAEPVLRQEQRRTFDARTQQMLVDYLNDSLDEAVNLPALAGLVGMSVSAFRRAFSGAFHTTPHQFVLDLRIRKAKWLLASTALTMTEISAVAGFSSSSHFANTFKQRVGCSPSAYRAENR